MKNKLLLTALATVCTVSCAIGLSACAKHEHSWGEWEKDATNRWHECLGEDCEEVADTAAHTYGEWKVTTTATEERDGERKRECTVCGYEQTETINKLAHTHKFADGWTKDETGHWHAATCEHTTEKDGFAAHTYGQWIEVTPATEQAKGSEKRVCSVCEYEDTRDIAQLDHTHSYKTEWAYDNANHWHACNKADCPATSGSAAHTLTETVISPATINAAGSKKIECAVCDYEKTESIPMLASKNYEVTLLDKTGAPVEGVTVKLGKYSAETDEHGKATVKAELAEYTVVLENTPSAVTYDELAKVTAENSQTTIYFAERANGGRIEESPYELTDGVYAALLNAVRSDMPANDGSYNYDVAARYFSVTATDGAVTARVEILNDNTIITSNDTDMISDKGAYYEVVVEQGERTVFCVTSADETITEDYIFTVFFKVSRSEAHDIGVYDRPARLADGAESVIAVESATQKVYYRLDNRVFGKYATVEFGSGVKVYYLGYNKTGELPADYVRTDTATIQVSASNTAAEVALGKFVTYTLTLVDGDDNPLPSIEVKLMNGSKPVATVTTNDSGVATTERIIAGEYTLSLSNNYSTTDKTSLTETSLKITCKIIEAIMGGTKTSPAVISESCNVSQGNSAYYKFSGTGTYKIKVEKLDAVDKQIYMAYLNGTTTQILTKGNTITNAGAGILKITQKDNTGIATEIQITLSENDFIVIGIKGAGTSAVTITKVPE